MLALVIKEEFLPITQIPLEVLAVKLVGVEDKGSKEPGANGQTESQQPPRPRCQLVTETDTRKQMVTRSPAGARQVSKGCINVSIDPEIELVSGAKKVLHSKQNESPTPNVSKT